MKTVVLVFSIALLSLGGCNKCGTCYYTRTVSADQGEGGYPQTNEYSDDGCGDNYKEMRKGPEVQTLYGTTITGKPATITLKRNKCN